MKRIKIIIVLLFLSAVVFGQSTKPAGKKYYTSSDYGWQWPRIKGDSAMAVPIGLSLRGAARDTGEIRYNIADSTVYVHTGNIWIKAVRATGGSTDSATFKTVWRARQDSAAIMQSVALKLNKSDSTAGGYYPYSTNPKGYLTGNKIDSIRSVKSLLFNSPSTFTLNGTTGVITETLASQAANSVFRTTTAGTPSFGTLDSTHVPALHSEGYYNTKYAAVGSGVDSTAYHTVSSVGTNGFSINTLKGVKDTIIFNIPDTSNKFVSQIYRTAGNDSIFYRIGTQVYAIKDSTGGGSSSGTRATRIALSPLAGQQFWQTDEAIGMYVYNGSSWEYQINPNNIIDQCHFANNTLTGTSFISFGAGTGNGVTFPNPENGYTSIISLNTGTTATGAIQVYNNNGSYWSSSNNSGVKYYSEFICKIPTLSNSTDRFICRINQANNWTSPLQGYWFEYSDTLNSGRWIIRTSDYSTVTTFNSSVTVDNNWHKYSIAYTSSTSISFYIDDVLITTATTNTAPSNSPLQISITKRIGTTSRSLYCDKIIMSTY